MDWENSTSIPDPQVVDIVGFFADGSKVYIGKAPHRLYDFVPGRLTTRFPAGLYIPENPNAIRVTKDILYLAATAACVCEFFECDSVDSCFGAPGLIEVGEMPFRIAQENLGFDCGSDVCDYSTIGVVWRDGRVDFVDKDSKYFNRKPPNNVLVCQ